ncbi:MAG: Acg family FMN-binding oxidoreductase [Oligoflexus sp.]|jgi:hypothetical protein
MQTRRNVLRLIGGGLVFAAAGSGGCAILSGPSEPAREPWLLAGQYPDFRHRALSYALLAPNPHNRQSWLVALEGENALKLYCDLDRRLPITDPFDRQITIGCGAFLEILVLAAASEGYQSSIQLFPEGEDMKTLDKRPIAHVSFTKSNPVSDPLFSQVKKRRSNKEVYLPRDVEESLLKSLAAEGSSFKQASETIGKGTLTDRLRELTWQAHRKEVMTPKANQESVDLMRIGAAEVTANPDGIELEGSLIEFGRIFGVINRESMADPNSTGFRQGLAMYEELAKSARAFGWICNHNASRSDQIQAGRAYVRVNLKATQLGLGIHPWSQSLQEYDEMKDLFREVHDLIGKGQRVQMLYRIGYGPDVDPTPRRGLKAHLV